ncbi:hypothetical protein CC80DRAFT_541833 [Byssothecium circinans]|uniref:Uncharacterized protein n=1 Tax=Byssothecium circinans TaxID=147558 RepID=A0A6A5UEE8_9PLEO|nr:hypothetical protein CC80DRAFT_541833 [Byssothecium circinans]
MSTFHCPKRSASWRKIITENLSDLASLAGFDGTTYWWDSKPTCTIRFIEVLSKLYASKFTVGEIVFLFTNKPHLRGDDPYPSTEADESLDDPLNVPEDDEIHGLWSLHRKLPDVSISEDDACHWAWASAQATLQVLEAEGRTVWPEARRFETQMPIGNTNAALWIRAGECSPFHIELRDERPGLLWANCRCRGAVQRLYLAPRAMLSPFAFIFSNFGRAAAYMVQEQFVYKRWRFFQLEFVCFVERCRIIAHHIHDAVTAASRGKSSSDFVADGNRAQTPWEDDSGAPPSGFDVDPALGGGAFAALLGLVGTGLLGKYGYGAAWTETRGGMSGWGAASNYWNSPVITVLPRLDIEANEGQSRFASFKNGFALNQDTGDVLTACGADPFTVTWCGVLLIEGDGCYHFSMRCPRHSDYNDNDGACHCEKLKQWSVTLQRGQKTWSLLEQVFDENENENHHSRDIPATYSKSVPLRRGAYDIEVKFHQSEPYFDDSDDLRRFHTGFALEYTGPDTDNCLIEQRVGDSFRGRLRPLSHLAPRYSSYIPASFQGRPVARRFCLSACRSMCEWESELGYLLGNPSKFHGTSYYLDAEDHFCIHKAHFDFNLLPVGDAYFLTTLHDDQKVSPSWKRRAALFDWFERIFDYTRLRKWVREVCEPPVWLLFDHANLDSPQPVAQLVRFLDIDIALSGLALEYFQPPNGVWAISDPETITSLADERWATRVWLVGRYVERLKSHFYAPTTEVVHCRPALWAASPDGNVQLGNTTGNVNLARFVQRSALSKTDAPPRLSLITFLNDGLRLRARDALLSFLNTHNYPATDLADRLLLNVKARIDETTTRIDDAIGAVQRFMQRVKLGLEASLFRPDEALLERWECELSSFDKWQAAQRRKWYCESWIHWEEAAKLSRSEGFQSLKKSLGAHVSTLSRPERGQFWDQPSSSSVPGNSTIPSAQAFGLQTIAPGRLDSQLSIDSSNGAQAALIILPGAETLEHIPLWIQAAVRLGTRFLRVAASGLPIAAPYERRDKTNPCCVCRKEHAPVVDEFYFWLQDAHRFDPADAPAPQNADLHVNTPGVNVPTSSTRHMDPRTGEADPTSDWDAPTPQMLAWRSQPLVHLHWTRVRMGVLLDPRHSTEGIPLTEEQLTELHLDLVGRTFDSLIFSLFRSTNDAVVGFRYDITTDRAVVLPEAITSTEPPALPLPASLSEPLTATSLVIAASLRVDCHFQEASNWLRSSYDPLGRDNCWMQCEEAMEIPRPSLAKNEENTALSDSENNQDPGPSRAKNEENTVLSDSENNPFVISIRKDENNQRRCCAGPLRVRCPLLPRRTRQVGQSARTWSDSRISRNTLALGQCPSMQRLICMGQNFKENSGLCWQCYELALQTSQEAQQALRFELGNFSLSYIPSSLGSWNSLHEGLLAGERLKLALCAIERAHMTKHCRLHFPAALVLLKATGYCEVGLPEWLFDLDYPGHYMRRIRAVSLTVPCVAGPNTGVHCKLQQLNSAIRFRPRRSNRDTCKCCPTEKPHDSRKTLPVPYPNEPHVWRRYAGTEAIATSTGQSDSGLYELSFNDARYLPFEYSGAVSWWRIELPPENNHFDFDSLSDLVMHISYTAREGGENFARESNMLAQRFLPGDGWRLFDVRHELPEVWNVMKREVECEVCAAGGDWRVWCEKCEKNHRAEEWKCRTHHEDYSEDDEAREHGNKRRLARPKKKKRPIHAERNFILSLTRERFPFPTG